jgi:predicted aldo/keto reductase-like oxidoreductase
MEYRKIGKTGIKASILGFGAMRFPMDEKGEKSIIREDESIGMTLRALELGINIIDTAYPYCHQQSEMVVGKALAEWKKKNRDSSVYISTKFPTWRSTKKSDYRKHLEEQLEVLGVDCIDFYHFHTLNENYFEEKVIKLGLLQEAIKAKEEGIIKHIAFSFHDIPEVMKKIIDTGYFEAVLCQYNILDRTNEEAIAYARKKGTGVFIMGPLAGGRIKDAEFFKESYSNDPADINKLALRFVFSNPDVTVAFSGMQNIKMIEENVTVAEGDYRLTDKDMETLDEFTSRKEIKELIPCNNCQYCLPCPNDVAIPKILKIYNYYKLTDIHGNSRFQYKNLVLDGISKLADECSECGQCEESCPQNIEVMKLLKEAHRLFNES